MAVVFVASALAVFLSAVNVYLRDTQHLVEVVLTAWFWACPIVYSYQQIVARSSARTAWTGSTSSTRSPRSS